MDVWHPKGKLIELTGEIRMQKLGIGRDARVCDVLIDGEWRFRNYHDQQIKGVIHDIVRFPLSLAVAEADGLS